MRAFEETFALSSKCCAARCRSASATGSAAITRGIPSSPRRTIATARRGSFSILGRYGGALRISSSGCPGSAQLAPPASCRLARSVRRQLPDVWEATAARSETSRCGSNYLSCRGVEATRRLTAARDATVSSANRRRTATSNSARSHARAREPRHRRRDAPVATVDPLLARCGRTGCTASSWTCAMRRQSHRGARRHCKQLGLPEFDGAALRRELLDDVRSSAHIPLAVPRRAWSTPSAPSARSRVR